MSSPFRPASSRPVHEPVEDAPEDEEGTSVLENVKYGDQVYFQMSSPVGGFMHIDKCFSRVGFQTSSEGTDVANFDECLFVVTPMLNYDSKQQAAMLARTGSKLGGDGDASGEEAMLQARLKQEHEQNKKLLVKCDKPPGDGSEELRYGQIIQLRHISTGKFLSGNSITAQVEKSCLRLSLSDGDDNCHFKLMPRFKVRHEGSSAYFTDLLILESVALDGYSLHVSSQPYDKEETPPLINEMSLSNESSSLKIMKFNKSDYKLQSEVYHTNTDFFRFYHPETESFLSASCDIKKNSKPLPNVTTVDGKVYNPVSMGLNNFSKLEKKSSSRRTTLSKVKSVITGGSSGSSLSTVAEGDSRLDPPEASGIFKDSAKGAASIPQLPNHRPYLRKLNDPSNPMSEANLSAKSVFAFETGGRKASTAVTWETPDVRIRHIPSGMYLYVYPTPVERPVDANDNIASLYWTGLTSDPKLFNRTLFTLRATDNQEEHIPKIQIALRLEHDIKRNGEKITLHMTSTRKHKDLLAKKTELESKSLDVCFSEEKGDNDALTLQPMDRNGPFCSKLLWILSTMETLRSFRRRMEQPGAEDQIHIRRNDITQTCAAIADIIYRADTFYDQAEHDKMKGLRSYRPQNALRFSNPSSVQFQNIARSVKLMDALFDVASSPNAVNDAVQKRGSGAMLSLEEDEKTGKFKDKAFDQISSVIKLAWHGLVMLFQGNRACEQYFANQPGWINPGVMNQIADPVGAAVAFNKLITSNKVLLETKVDSAIIEKFIELIKKRGPQERLMRFFSAICVCVDVNVLSNQETCLNQLLVNEDNKDQILFEIKTSEAGRPQYQKINSNKEDIPEAYLGKNEVNQAGGYKSVRVVWEKITKLKDLKFPAGNGKHSCTVEDFFRILNLDPIQLKLNEKQHYQAANYVLAQIELFESMCYGRSYNCIFKLQTMFPYTMTMGLIANEDLPDCVRNVFTRLMHRLWVDRYPHAPNCGRPQLPDLAWVASDLKMRGIEENGALPCFDLGDYHPLRLETDEFLKMSTHTKFFLLRDFVNDYLAQMGGSQGIGNKDKNELTTSILLMASDLMSFGFFATKGKVKDFLGPLINVLDGRGDRIVKKEIKERSESDTSMTSNTSTNPLHAMEIEGGDEENQVTAADTSSSSPGGSKRQEKIQAFVDVHKARMAVGRQRYDSDNPDAVRVMNCKINMFQVLGKVANMRANFRIQRFLYQFYQACQEGKIIVGSDGQIKEEYFQAFEELFTSEDGAAMDMAKMSGDQPMDTYCLDLMLYRKDELYMSSLSFMRRRFGQRKALLGFLPKVTLLPSHRLPVFTDFKMLDQDLQQLRYFIRSYEVWGVRSKSSGLDQETYLRVCLTLDNLYNFVYADSETNHSPCTDEERDRDTRQYLAKCNRAILEREKDKVPNRPDASSPADLLRLSKLAPSKIRARKQLVPNKLHQALLRNMGMAREVLFHGVEIDYEIMRKMVKMTKMTSEDKIEVDTKESENRLFNVCLKVVNVLAAFVDGDPSNQAILFGKLGLLQSKMSRGFNIWDVVISIFENNVDLSERCPVELFIKFANLVEKSNYSSRHIDFFLNLVEPDKSVGSRVIVRNQNLAIKALTDPQFTKTLLLEPPASSSKSLEELENEELFHLKSLELLALCAKGRNSYAGAKAQSLVDLGRISHYLASNAKQSGNKRKLATVLLTFATNVYVETPLRDSQLAESKDMWGILVIASNLASQTWKESQRALNEGSIGVEEYELLFACLNLLKAFFVTTYTKEASTKRIESASKVIEAAMEFMTRSRFVESDMNQGAATLGMSSADIVDRVKVLSETVLGILKEGEGPAEEEDPFEEKVMPMVLRKQKYAEEQAGTGSDYSEDALRKLMREDFQAYLEKCMNCLLKSDSAAHAMDLKEQQYLFTLEKVEERTDPLMLEYLQAATDVATYDGKDFEEKKRRGADEDDGETIFERMRAGIMWRCQLLYTLLMSGPMLGVILFFTFIAAFATIYQMAINKDIVVLAVLEYVISWFFIIELGIRIFTYVILHGEFDNFLMDPLNIIDIFVVIVDCFLMIAGDNAEGDVGGLVKGLRSARGFRLLRLLRALRAMRGVPPVHKMTHEEASKDARSVKISLAELCMRQLTFIRSNIETNSVQFEANLVEAFSVLSLHLEKYERRTHMELKGCEPNPLDLLDSTEEEIQDERDSQYVGEQRMVMELDAAEVICLTLCSAESERVQDEAFRLGKNMLNRGFTEGQEKFLQFFTNKDPESLFFFAIRDRIRACRHALVDYTTAKEINEASAEKFKAPCEQILQIFNFMAQLCEGHNLETQNILREQPYALKTCNLFEESLDFVVLQGKNMAEVRQMNSFEAELLESTLGFLVESMQGPCGGNQDFLVRNPKVLDVCKNVLSCPFKNITDSSLKWRLYHLSTGVMCAMLESRGDNLECHQLLIQSLPYDLVMTGLSEAAKMETKLGYLRNGKVPKDKEDLTYDEKQLEKMGIHAFYDSYNTLYWANDNVHDEWSAKAKISGPEKEEADRWRDELFADLRNSLDGMRRDLFTIINSLREVRCRDGNAFMEEHERIVLQTSKGRPPSGDDPTIQDNTNVRTIEIYWQDFVHKVQFTLPDEWPGFSEASKNQFIAGADLSNAEARAKSLIEKYEELYDEMSDQFRLGQSRIYRLLAENYMSLKKLTYLVVIALNFNIMISPFESLEEVNIYNDLVAAHLTAGEKATAIMGLAALTGYGICLLYLSISFGPLAFRRSNARRREMKKENDAKKENKISSTDLGVVTTWLGVLAFYAALAYIHKINDYGLSTDTYVKFGAILAYLSAPWVLRHYLVIPNSKVLSFYCAAYDTVTYGPVFTHLLLMVTILVGMDKSFWFTFTLLDCLNMSELLAATIKSVTQPISQLAQTFALFIVVICCYTAIAFFLFGNSQFVLDDDDDADQACTTLIECFLFSLYVGLREGDMDAVLADADVADPTVWRNRMLYDITFFVVLGVLLFDVVTGVILDTFGELREEVNDRADKMENETYISGITREKIEELEGNAVDFTQVNQQQQDKWNYLYFLIYLNNKEPSEMNGAESYVSKAVADEDTCWLPQKTCWAMQMSGASADDELSPEEMMEEQVAKLESVEKSVQALVAKLEEAEEV
ncbi:hypothetical protein TrST_g8820 [Triparma strigata]|uniref:MIR domain-containing protein n=1 Tax=Triparma strigata TaxID=1606541 RepID=A0A9W7F2G5_9STRA|nr:hypothetical protein TrST_g8820 [Triparma strigata]